MKLSENLTKKEKTLYQRIAEKYEVSSDYVGFIARGERRGIRGKGLIIRTELEALAQNSETQNQ
jgi:hypothetical protein